MRVLVIGYFTRDTPYVEEAKAFAKSCDRFGLDFMLSEVDPFENWNAAVAAKPRICHEIISAEREPDAYLYVDVDARFEKLPDFAALEHIGFGAHQWKRTAHHELETLTGTMWFLNCDTTLDFLDDWATSTPPYQYMDCPEQQSLKLVLERWRPLMTFRNLPPEWVWIDGDFEKKYGADRSPILVHYQASRRYKNVKDGQIARDAPDKEH